MFSKGLKQLINTRVTIIVFYPFAQKPKQDFYTNGSSGNSSDNKCRLDNCEMQKEREKKKIISSFATCLPTRCMAA